MVAWNDRLFEIEREIFEEAVAFLRESIPKQAAMPNGDTTEFFSRNFNKSGKTVDGIHVPGTKNRMCFGSVETCSAVMKKIKRNNGRFKNKKAKVFIMRMNVHLHPGTDTNSMKFSGPDISLSEGQRIPVFIGNMNGDVAVFMPGMNKRGGLGPQLCEGCAK